MAQLCSSFLLLLLLFLLLVSVATAAGEDYGFLQSVRTAPMMRKEKLSHFRFYWHDIVSGRNPTSMTVIITKQNLLYLSQ